MYRKERKKRKRGPSLSGSDSKQQFRGSSDDGSSCCSTNTGAPADVTEFNETTPHTPNTEPPPNESIPFDVNPVIAAASVDHSHESESCSSSVESAVEEDRVALRISERLRNFLELDCHMITKKEKLVNLPAKIPVVTILENFVKYQSIKSICGPHPADLPKRRNSAAKTERREKDYDKLMTR